MTTTATPDTIVLIHGLWMNGRSWERWQARYEERGLRVLAPSWPGMEGDVEALRADTSAFDDLGVAEIVEHYAGIIDGLGAAGVAIDPAPLKGMHLLPLSTLRAGSPVLHNPANRHRAVALTPKEFHYAFTNTLDEEGSQEVFDRYAVPGPGRVLFEGALANLSPHSPVAVDFHDDDRAPLLLIAGGEDHVSPAALTRSNLKKYDGEAVTELKVFEGRSHYTLGQDGWEEVADYALDWALGAAVAA